MVLLEILKEKQGEILNNWIDHIFSSYPSDTSRFLKREKDRFNNPVGFTFKEECPKILDEFLGEMTFSRIRDSLEKIIKIRAIQDFSPSQALDFLFRLKQILLEEFKPEINSEEQFQHFLEVDNRLEKLFLIGFDIYSSVKEKIAEVRINEMRQRTAILMKRANDIFENNGDFLISENNEPDNQ